MKIIACNDLRLNRMLKKLVLILTICFAARFSHAQSSADSVYNKFLDFNVAMLDNDAAHAVELGEEILPKVAQLKPTTQVRFYDGLAKMYEDNYQPEKAIIYYLKVTTAATDYYVAHRALGYLYLKSVDEIDKKLQASQNNNELHNKLLADYKAAAQKALPHLEKAQACDPSEETLQVIKNIYQIINDQAALNSLNNKLKQLGSKCEDLLKD
jgi:hypothetical protein